MTTAAVGVVGSDSLVVVSPGVCIADFVADADAAVMGGGSASAYRLLPASLQRCPPPLMGRGQNRCCYWRKGDGDDLAPGWTA